MKSRLATVEDDCRLVLSYDCQISAVNAAALAWVGTTSKQMVGRSYWDFVAPSAPCGRLIKQAIAERQPIRTELRSSIRPDRWLAYNLQPEQRNLVVAFRDITDRMVSRDFHEEGHALLQTMIDALSAHAAVLDASGTVIATNHAWRAFNKASGYRAHIGQNYIAICEKAAQTRAGAHTVLGALKEVFAGGRSEVTYIYGMRALRQTFWFQMRATSFKLGSAERVLVVHEDVTDVHRASENQRELGARLLETAKEERRRIARELHDSTSQHLTAVSLLLAVLEEGPDAQARKDAFAQAHTSLGEAQREIRTLSYLLHPPLEGPHSLATAAQRFIEGFEKRTNLSCSLRAPKAMPSLNEERATAMLRVLQEALANVHKHAAATTAQIRLRCGDGRVELEVKDDGSGIEILDWNSSAEMIVFGVGIPGMRARMQQFHGDISIRRDRKGTILRAWLPCEDSPIVRIG